MTSYKLIGCNSGCTSTNINVRVINPDSNIGYILSNVLSIGQQLNSTSANVDYLNTITQIDQSGLSTNEKQIEFIKYITTERIPGEQSLLGPPYGLDRLLTETLGGICVSRNNYTRINEKSIIIEKYFNGTSEDTLFTSASMGKIQLVMIVSSMIKQKVSWYNGVTRKQLSLLTTVEEIVEGTDIILNGFLPGIKDLRIIDFLQFKTGLTDQSGLLYIMRKEPPGKPPFITNSYLAWNITINYSNLVAADSAYTLLYGAAAYTAVSISQNSDAGYGTEAAQAFFAGIYNNDHKDYIHFFQGLTPTEIAYGPAAMARAKTFLFESAVPFNVSIRAYINYLRNDPTTYVLGDLLNLLGFTLPEIVENPIEIFFGKRFKQNVTADTLPTNPKFEYDFETVPLLGWLTQIVICKAIRDKSLTPPNEFSSASYTAVNPNDLNTVYNDIQLDGDDNLYIPSGINPFEFTPHATAVLLRDNIRAYFQRHIILPAGLGRNNKNCNLQSGPSGCIYYDYNRFAMPDLTKIGLLILKDLHLMGWTGDNAETFTTANCEATEVMDGYHLYNIITMYNADIPGNDNYDYPSQSLFNVMMYVPPPPPGSPYADPIFPGFLSVSNNMPIMSNGMWVVNKNGIGFNNNNIGDQYLVSSASDFANRKDSFNFEAQRLEWHGSAGQLLYLDPEHDLCTCVLNIPFSPRNSPSIDYYQDNKNIVTFSSLSEDVIADIDLYHSSPYDNMYNAPFPFDVRDVTKYITYNIARIIPDFNAYVLSFDKNAFLSLVYNNDEMKRLTQYISDNTVSVNDEGFESYPLLTGTDSQFFQMVLPLPGVASPPPNFYNLGTLINYFNDVIYPKIITILL